MHLLCQIYDPHQMLLVTLTRRTYIDFNFCILCNKNGIKGLWGHKGRPSLGPGPALVLQWTLPRPYNTPNEALYILALFLHSMQQKWD